MLLYLFARLRVDQDLADAYPATIAAAGMPDLVVVWCASERIAVGRYPLGVHWAPFPLGPGLGSCELRGAICVYTTILACCLRTYNLVGIIPAKLHPEVRCRS